MKTKKAIVRTRAKQPARAETKPTNDWRSLCTTLLEERERMRGELALLKAENKVLKDNLAAVMFEEIEIDKEKLLAEAVYEPTIDDFIAELRVA